MNLFGNLLGSATATLTDILVYIVIIVVFLLGVGMCVAPVVDTRNRLRRAIRDLRDGDKSKRSWQENNFLGRGALMAHWSAYLNNLFFADGAYHNASNVEDFINEDTVIYGPGRSTFADAVPSLLVSLGFLGTLIGLAGGLAGFDMTDSSTVQSSITTLIPGMKYAFMTSIFGVVGSVGFTMLTRAVYGSAENTLKTFYSALRRNAGVLSVDPLTQVAIYQQEQTALIQTMAKDLNGSFTENITRAIQDALEPVHQSLRSFMNVTSKEQIRFLDAVTMRFVDRMNEALGGQLKQFGETLKQVNDEQLTAFAAVRVGLADSEKALRTLRELQTLAEQTVVSMADYLKDFDAAQKQSQDAMSRIGSTVEQMDLVSRQQISYLKTVGALQSEASRSVEEVSRSVDSFVKRFADETAAAAQSMTKATDGMVAASQRLESVQTAFTKSVDAELKDTLDAYRDYVNQFTQRVDYLASGIADSLSKMPAAVGETADAFLDQMDRLTEAAQRARQALDDALRR